MLELVLQVQNHWAARPGSGEGFSVMSNAFLLLASLELVRPFSPAAMLSLSHILRSRR